MILMTFYVACPLQAWRSTTYIVLIWHKNFKNWGANTNKLRGLQAWAVTILPGERYCIYSITTQGAY